MDKRVYLLTIVSFIVGLVELILGGILDLVAFDLGVTLGQVGMLISIFSLVFAVFGPILLTATATMERKKLTLIALVVFFFANLLAVLSSGYAMLLVARIISAMSGALLIALCVTIASNIVSEEFRARAIGIVFMGISASLVLGVPAGLMLGNAFGWRAPFIMITALTALSFIGVYFLMDKIEPKPALSIKKQLQTLKNRKILLIQLTSFLFLAGHLTLYAYLTPFLRMTMGMDGTWISMMYLIFGVAAIIGGGVGGMLADRFGTKPTIVGVIIVFAVSIFTIPYTTSILPLFLVVMVVWSMLSWAITPAIQSYLIETAPETSDIQQSLNNSALHFGIAAGSMIGGIVIEQSTVEMNATVGGVFVLFSLGVVIMSMVKRKEKALSTAA
ncbi:major facilitator transporter possible arabinose [Alkalihalophilus pseudofirmus OF4]|uniref:Major facilitator transporter possible arabinose n=1 Tax=Alkalihalophilus pseudofirmus (strain ATCC BAA-2126 / JCM 17055 / OF4) TaxID=398511 RepID=D3FYX2_ALKPO|nr:MFS transporter [Alkalihalophilus pseudofirmus]ADC49005.1 major facilitator transporter possible arabinose [Alkalihalophilus pseudofirmus OF4]